MRRLSFVLMSALSVTVLLSGCSALKSMKKNAGKVEYTVTPQILEVHGGIVKADVTVQYPAKYFKRKVVLTSTPTVKYTGGAKEMKKIGVQGEKVRGNYKVIPYKAGGTFSFTDQVPYSKEMQVSEFVAEILGTQGIKSLVIDNVKLADGVIATSQLVKVSPKTMTAADQYVRITEDAIEGQIMYLINRDEVRKSELKGESLNQLRADMAAAKENERIEIKNAQVLAYASPDGALDYNTKLAGKRTDSGEKVFLKDLKEANIYDGTKNDFLQLLTTPEDWDGFKKMMEESSIKDKELILRVLQMYPDPAVREREIKNIAAAYDEIKDQILPQLRRSRLRLNLNKIGLSDAEIKDLGASNPSVLKLEEVLRAASLYEGNVARQISILESAVKSYPDCWRAKNNLAAAYLQTGRLNDAEAALTAAAKIKNDPMVANNFGALYLLKGDVAKAEESLNAAGSAQAVNYNLGLVKTMQGKYADALSKFGNINDVNVALAKLLSKQDDAALSTLNNLSADDALVAYLKAVVGARKGNNDLVFSNLRIAVKNADLKANAKKDLEFVKLFNDATFKTIVQ
ncbi:MAG: tetratricopeptide repeat protein [Bacteroidales bacterium]|nr:tetratricopeptide repeat protein [Bacteroidales bacterium]